jgi:hypothetical protein
VTPTRAFWEAFATVFVPSALIWGAAFLFVRPTVTADELPVWLLLFLLPFPLALPIYYRYRKDIRYVLKPRSLRYHLISAFSFFALSVAYVIEAVARHHDRSQLFFPLTMAICWVGVGLRELWLAREIANAKNT